MRFCRITCMVAFFFCKSCNSNSNSARENTRNCGFWNSRCEGQHAYLRILAAKVRAARCLLRILENEVRGLIHVTADFGIPGASCGGSGADFGILVRSVTADSSTECNLAHLQKQLYFRFL